MPMTDWTVKAVHYDYPDAGSVTTTLRLQARTHDGALALGRARVGYGPALTATPAEEDAQAPA